MDHITLAELERLATSHGDAHVSIYIPTQRAGDQIQQNRIYLKNHLDQAEQDLEAQGMRPAAARELLGPGRELVNDHDFWQYQSDGLALLLNSEELHTFRLPLSFPALVTVMDRYHLKPLLAYFANGGHYFILALDAEGVSLYHATKHSVSPLDLSGKPHRLSEFLVWEDPERQLQWHTSTGRVETPFGERGAMFHGHGAGGEAETDTEDLLRFLRALDNAIYEMLAGHAHPPLVLIGGESALGHYGKVNHYPNLVGEVALNPHHMDPAELHKHTWPVVEPIFGSERDNAMSRVQSLKTSGQGSTDLTEIALAAHNRQVDVLFVAEETQRWGRFDPDDNRVEVHESRQSGDQDLVDFAVVHTLLNGGDAFVVPPDEVPGDGIVAAFRYASS